MHPYIQAFVSGLKGGLAVIPVAVASIIARFGLDAAAFLVAENFIQTHWQWYESVATIGAIGIGVWACWPLVRKYLLG